MQDLINAKIKELTENGKLDEIIEKQAINFIENIVRGTLESYSDVSKAYKQKLNEQMLSRLETFDFIQYSKTLSDLIETELNKSVLFIGIEPIKEMIDRFTGTLEKSEWKLSEIIEKFKDDEVIPDDHGESGEISFNCEQSDYGTYHISFDKDEDKAKRYACKYRLMIDGKTKKLYAPTIDGIGIHPMSEGGGLYGFDLFLFKLYAMGCTIICDEYDIEKEWSTYN